MLFRRKKIKITKTKKVYPYGRMSGINDSSTYYAWDSMSIIEKFALIFLPIMLCSMFYIMLEMTGLIWWTRLIISIGIVGLIIGLLTLLVNWLTEIY